MIDCHAHLSDISFSDDLPAVLDRAASAGVEQIICVAEDLNDCRHVLALAEQYHALRPCLGLHPDAADPDEAAAVEELIRKNAHRLIGIGEVGLDFWIAREEPEREIQRRVLSRFVRLSRELDLPLNVHSRSAGHYTLDLLLAAGAQRVLMHAFDGKVNHAWRGVAAGYLFSIPPSVIRSHQKQKLVRQLPLEALATETDSPVLGPEPGRRNEPAHIPLVVQTVADLKQVPPAQVREMMAANARRLFRLIPG
ncbi:MAG: TatD family hydrolase [Acidobacteria bacterium]|nr:TatD family hydrolase [Acidobacteriota bacterium]